jgi:hypothetical protein
MMKNHETKNKIENVFRFSNNSDEIFDAVDSAIRNKYCDIELYKILLGNPALSKDELIMFAEKLSREFTICCYDLYIWTAKIFGNNYLDNYNLEKSLHYLKKASDKEPAKHEPYIAALKLYNYDLDLPINKKIIEMLSGNFESVEHKPEIYIALADHYNRLGNLTQRNKYRALAEKNRH